MESSASDHESQELANHQMISIDEIIEKYVGGFGRAQFIQVVIVALAWAFDSQHTFVTIFTDAQPLWRCTNTNITQFYSQIWGTQNCTAESSICEMDPTVWEWEKSRGTSVVSEWNLVCANSFKAGLPALCFFMGSLLGCILLGPLADSSLGRRRMLMASCFMLSVTGFLTALSPNIWVYSVLRAISGFGRSSMGTYCLVLSTELVGRKWRGLVGFFVFFAFTLGFLSLPALAYLTRIHFSWRSTYIYISILPLVYAILFLPLVWDSPRWLLLGGKSGEALQCLIKMAKLNGRSLPENIRIYHYSGELQADSALSRLWTTRWARKRVVLIMVVGFGMGLIYFGMPLDVGNMDFNLYLSVTFNALSEVPAAIASTILVAKQGRRSSIILLTLISGMFCYVCAFFSWKSSSMHSKKNWLEMVSELGAFVSAVTAFNVVLIYCMELFPTTVRNSAMSMLRQAINAGAAVCPVIVVVGHSAASASFLIFGSAIIMSGLFVSGLPETQDRPLFETLEDQESHENECKISTSLVTPLIS